MPESVMPFQFKMASEGGRYTGVCMERMFHMHIERPGAGIAIKNEIKFVLRYVML